eukprot:1186414-Prorocentrum_minimum.AAC.1
MRHRRTVSADSTDIYDTPAMLPDFCALVRYHSRRRASLATRLTTAAPSAALTPRARCTRTPTEVHTTTASATRHTRRCVRKGIYRIPTHEVTPPLHGRLLVFTLTEHQTPNFPPPYSHP